MTSSADPAGQAWLTAEQAARILGVSRATLYAYVSRGLLSAERLPGQRGSKHYRSSEVQRLALQRSAARRPRIAARASLDWGLPVLASGLCLIEAGQLYYRGQSALQLAQDQTLEQVAALLWQCDERQAFDPDGVGLAMPLPGDTRVGTLAKQPLAQRCVSAAALMQARTTECKAALEHDGPNAPLLTAQAAAFEPPSSVATCGALVRALVALVLGTRPSAAPVHIQLQQAWGLDDVGGQSLRRALVLCADHELNASSFTARCVAGTGASLPACLNAALLALSGPRHGGMTELVEAWWPRWSEGQIEGASPCDAAALPQAGLQSAASALPPAAQPVRPDGTPAVQALPGFGHPLYPDGDPRARVLLRDLPGHAQLLTLQARLLQTTGLRPALDLALVALRRHLGLPRGAAFALFAIGRSVGWLAHALEQRGSAELIRPRADYTGPRPGGPPDPVGAGGRIIRQR